MLRLAGWWWIGVSALHCLGGIILYLPQWYEISQAGWFNVIAPDIFVRTFPRESAFWFILLCPFMYLIGKLCLWANRQKLVFPISVGIVLLSTMLIGVFFVPVSGFWLGLPPSIMLLWTSKTAKLKTCIILDRFCTIKISTNTDWGMRQVQQVNSNLIKRLGDRAIVIGGSIAGLLSARVLSDYFKQVVIVDRDKLPETPQARRGVPQSVQPHVLFTKGYRILGEFFPGIEQQLETNGALTIDWAREFKHFVEGHWGVETEHPSDIVSVTCSRYLLEWTIRQELLKLPQISFAEESKVAGLVYDSEAEKVTGVDLHSGARLKGDLIIDASGRSSQASQWLKRIEKNPPTETVVNPFLGYATRRYRLPDNFPADWKVMLISQTPPKDTRLGYLAKIENGELIATLGGYGKDFPPLDDSGFLEFAQSLAQPDFYQAIASATPTSPIYAHRATANRLRHYEETELPQGFIALGDAVCALCPVYGQGMTVSALGAKVLQAWLSKSSRQKLNNNSFQKQLAKSNSFHWMLATSQDSRFLTTQGRKDKEAGIVDKIMTGYMNKLLSKSASQPDLHLMFLEVAHLLRSPLALYNPLVVWQVLTAEGGQRRHRRFTVV